MLRNALPTGNVVARAVTVSEPDPLRHLYRRDAGELGSAGMAHGRGDGQVDPAGAVLAGVRDPRAERTRPGDGMDDVGFGRASRSRDKRATLTAISPRA
jgi:hypothetical protein